MSDQEACKGENEYPVHFPYVLLWRSHTIVFYCFCCSASWRFQRAVRLKSAQIAQIVNEGNVTLIKLRLIKDPTALTFEVAIKLKNSEKLVNIIAQKKDKIINAILKPCKTIEKIELG